jgi:hypothetical protein
MGYREIRRSPFGDDVEWRRDASVGLLELEACSSDLVDAVADMLRPLGYAERDLVMSQVRSILDYEPEFLRSVAFASKQIGYERRPRGGRMT